MHDEPCMARQYSNPCMADAPREMPLLQSPDRCALSLRRIADGDPVCPGLAEAPPDAGRGI